MATQGTINEHGWINQKGKETLPKITNRNYLKVIKISIVDESTDQLIEKQLIVPFITREHKPQEIYRTNKQIKTITIKTIPLIPTPNQATKPIVLIHYLNHQIKSTS